jgi:hypothetical protein
MLTPTKGNVGVNSAVGDGRPVRVVASLLLVMLTGLGNMRNCNYRHQNGIHRLGQNFLCRRFASVTNT